MMEYLNLSFTSTSEPDFVLTNSTVSSKQVGTAVFLSLCFLVGWPSNIAVIVTIVRKWNSDTNFTEKLVLNLAISDSLVVGLVPIAVYSVLNGWTLGLWSCRILMYLTYCAMYVSVLSVTMMAVHRYHAVKSKIPNRNKLEQLQKNHRHFLLIGIWTFAVVFALPILFIQSVEFKHGSPRCQRTIESPSGKVTFRFFEIMLGFVVPFSIILASYWWISKTMLQGGKGKEKVKKRTKRMKSLVISMVTAFFLFWTPVHVINVIDIVTTLTETSYPAAYHHLKYFRRATGDLSKTVSVINCCVNPFLYAVASGFIKKGGLVKKETGLRINSANVS